MRYPATPDVDCPDTVGSVDAVHDRLICDEEAAVAESPVGTVGAVVSVVVVVFDTVMVIDDVVVLFPAVSRAVAARVWAPFADAVVVQDVEYGDVVSSVPRLTPSSLNWTPATPMLSEAVAETVIVPDTVVPVAGQVIATVGRVVPAVPEVVPPELLLQAVRSMARLSRNSVSVEATGRWRCGRVSGADVMLCMFPPFKFQTEVLRTVVRPDG